MIFPTGTLNSGSQTGNDKTNQGQSGSGDISQGGEGGQDADKEGQDANEGAGPEDETVA
jgi:hypothetical protein